MFSFLEIDKSNLTNLSKEGNKILKQEDLQEEAFSKILNDFIEDKEEAKKAKKPKKEKILNLPLKEKESLDNEEIVEEQTIDTKQEILIKENKKHTKEIKEPLKIVAQKPVKKSNALGVLKSAPQNAKELLQMAKEGKSSKTLKDILQKANDLNLVVKKINLQEDVQKEETQKPNKVILQEVFQEIKKDAKDLKEKKNSNFDNVLSSLLQDKKILEDGKKAEKEVLLKREKIKEMPSLLKENKANIKVIKEDIQNLKEVKNLSQEKIITTLKEKEEPLKETKDFKDSKISLNPKENISKDIILESSSKIVKVKESLKQEKLKPSFKEDSLKEKNIQDIKENKANIKVIKEDIQNLKEVKNLSQEKTITTLNLKKQEEKELLKETKDFKDSKISLNPKENISKDIILESSSKVVKVKENAKQEKLKPSYHSIKREKGTKEDRIMDKYYEKGKFALQDQNLLNIVKEEIQTKETSEQNFLNNLLKMQNSVKNSLITESKENHFTQKEAKEKIHQEIYQSVIQNQSTERFSIQNTFIHFSDKLKEALQNYRPPVTKISLELNPQNLGSVELTITKRGDNIHIQIGSNPQALQLFMQNAQDFKNQLGNLGFNEVQMDFKDTGGNSLGAGFGDSSGGNSQQNFHQNSQNNQKRNENSLYVYQQANDSYGEISHMDLSFSYDA